MSSRLLRSGFGNALLAWVLASAALAQQPGTTPDLAQAHRTRIAKLYGQESWPVGAHRIGLANDLDLTGWRAVDLQAAGGFLTRTFKRARPESEQVSFVLESHVAQTARGAHQDLLRWLAGLQSPQRMPAIAELGFEVGDVGFFGRSGAGPGAQAWVAFVRGNVAVRVLAFDARRDPGLNLAGIAREIDQTLLALPTVPRGTALPRPVVRELVTQRPEIVAGERVRLGVQVQDPHGGTPHLTWTVGGSGQGYVEQTVDGVLFLYTTGPGSIELGLEVTGSTGTYTRASVVVDVLDD